MRSAAWIGAVAILAASSWTAGCRRQSDAPVAERAAPAESMAAPATGDATPIELVAEGRLPELESLIAQLQSRDARDEQGASAVGSLFIELGLQLTPFDEDGESGERLIRELLKNHPDSPIPPLLEAQRLRFVAGASGAGHPRSKADAAAKRQFHELSCASWELLMKHRDQASAISVWYPEAIFSGRDCGIDLQQIHAIFAEGSRRFPGFDLIFSAYVGLLTPARGGDFERVREFIVEQADALGGEAGDVRYAKLFMTVDFNEGFRSDFVEAAGVDWPRVDRGLKTWQRQYPGSSVSVSGTRAHFACRAGDAAVYREASAQLQPEHADTIMSVAAIPEDCDQRFGSSGN